MGRKINLFLLLFSLFIAQAVASETDTLSTAIDVHFSGINAKFRATLPPLSGIAGGRAPFYTYLWDFGDGHFSTEESPVHQYKRPGEYDVVLYTVSNYDNGPRPKRPRRKLKVERTQTAGHFDASPAEKNFFAPGGIFRLGKNSNAVPGQDMVLIAGLRTTEKGRVFLLTNEKVFDKEGFVYAGQTTYNLEKPAAILLPQSLKEMWAAIPAATITQSGSPDYGDMEEITFDKNEALEFFSEMHDGYRTITSYEVQPGEQEQFSLVNLDITPEMIADTNATVTITGVFVPEKGPARIHKLDIPVIKSHDPNKMSLKQSRLNYRSLSRRKKLTYKVQFQNDGEGDVKNIRLEMKLPQILDLTTFKLLNLYPQCDSCGSDPAGSCYTYEIKGRDTLVFKFKNVALPGSKAADIQDRDSTKGFIRFEITPKKKLPNQAFRGQTSIYFDKNEAVVTNQATGNFRKSLSPILFAGYNHFLKSPNSSDAKNGGLFGLGLAPLAPYRKLYWQAEIYANTSGQSEFIGNIAENGPFELPQPGGGTQTYYYERYDRSMGYRTLQLRVVPLQLRYNFNSWISAGAGALAEKTFYSRAKETRTYYVIISSVENPMQAEVPAQKPSAGKWQLQPFLDVNFGRVYLGPALGIRYIYGSKQGQIGQLYTAWRF